MDIYDSRYFTINKKLLVLLGVWPYGSKSKYFIRTFHMLVILILFIPQAIGVIKNHTSWERLLINLYFTLSGGMIFFKILIFGLAEKKLKIMFDGIARTWQTIVDEEENKILCKYSERGRMLTIVLCLYYSSLSVVFCLSPLVPVILNKLNPQSEPLPYIYMLQGEFLLKDHDKHYFKIYFWELASIAYVIFSLCPIDTIYLACIHHCLGLFAIIRFRVRNHGFTNDCASIRGYSNYKWIVETVKLHQRILQFIKTLEESYSHYFFCVLIFVTISIPLCCNLVLINLEHPIQLIRFGIPFAGISFILFSLCWPGQQLINQSSNLLQDTYCNKWYETSARSKKILILFMHRCLEPCKITAAGLLDMNFETFYSIMKKAISYIMVLASLQ